MNIELSPKFEVTFIALTATSRLLISLYPMYSDQLKLDSLIDGCGLYWCVQRSEGITTEIIYIFIILNNT